MDDGGKLPIASYWENRCRNPKNDRSAASVGNPRRLRAQARPSRERESNNDIYQRYPAEGYLLTTIDKRLHTSLQTQLPFAPIQRRPFSCSWQVPAAAGKVYQLNTKFC